MSFRVRPATGDDFRAIYQMAKLTGGGFTNLPADRGTLVAKLERSDKSFARKEECQVAKTDAGIAREWPGTLPAIAARHLERAVGVNERHDEN